MSKASATSEPRVKVSVKEGIILVDGVWVDDTGPVIIITIETRSKYPRVSTYSSGQVNLVATKESLKTGKTDVHTTISIDLPKGFSVNHVDCGRYSVTLICYDILGFRESYLAWDCEGNVEQESTSRF
jgi:hypothetical protein